MSIFSIIRERIMAHRQAQATAGQAQAPTAQSQDLSAGVFAGLAAAGAAASQTVDVEQVLEDISRRKGDPDLNWRSSIVDLMKLLDLDSSLSNRADLADELGYTGERNGSAEMNIWLHRRVMEELEKNGGRVPESLKS